jgi:diguanylate cyclase (GGDEF)-like protein
MVIERYRLQEELRRHAYHDSLTGLSNRLLGEKQLSEAITRRRATASSLAVLWIDLDKFKQTNDVHGHLAGDAVLQEVAARLGRRFNDSHAISRMGGDEFMALIEDFSDRSQLDRLAAAVVSDLSRPVEFQGLMLTTAASVGAAAESRYGDV